MKAFKSLVATSLLLVAGAVLMYGMWMMIVNPSLTKAEVFSIFAGCALVLYFTAEFSFSQTGKVAVRSEPQSEEMSSPAPAAEDKGQPVVKSTESVSKPKKAAQATRTGSRQPKAKAVKLAPKTDVPEELYTVPAYVRRERAQAEANAKAKAAKTAPAKAANVVKTTKAAKPAAKRKQPLVSKDVYDSSLSDMFGPAA